MGEEVDNTIPGPDVAGTSDRLQKTGTVEDASVICKNNLAVEEATIRVETPGPIATFESNTIGKVAGFPNIFGKPESARTLETVPYPNKPMIKTTSKTIDILVINVFIGNFLFVSPLPPSKYLLLGGVD